MTKRDGGPAFPTEQGFDHNGQWNQTYEPGMSKREYFAGQIMAALASSPETPLGNDVQRGLVAGYGVMLADALLQALAQGEQS